MKKTIVLVIVLAVVASSLSALDFVVGPKLGIADYNWRGDDGPTADAALSLSWEIGGFVNFQLTSMIGMQVEAMYTMATIRYKTGSNWVQYGINSISLPAYARFDFDVGGLGVYALAGPQFDFLFGDARLKSDSSDWVNIGNVGDLFDNTVLISAAGGAGVSLPIGPGVIDFGAGIKFGLTRLIDNSDLWSWAIDAQLAYGFSL